MPANTVNEIVNLMKLQYEFARTGKGWSEYATARAALVSRLGRAPESFPATPDDGYWDFVKRLYLYDPEPTLRRLRTPTLAFFGEVDDNIVADKNRSAWDAALSAAGNPDYTLVIVPKANHALLETPAGHPGDLAYARRFAPMYASTLLQWLSRRFATVR
jgi:pimeloyl-ACP methyl ester carboxylesterase